MEIEKAVVECATEAALAYRAIAGIRHDNQAPESFLRSHVAARLHRRLGCPVHVDRLYAAMAVEGFLNWYGVFRLGEEIFNQHFERLGLVPKLRVLLLVCDSIHVGKGDQVVLVLVHSSVDPKHSREISLSFIQLSLLLRYAAQLVDR